MEPNKWTDEELLKLEKRIRREYSRAAKDIFAALQAFLHGTPYTDADGNLLRGKSLLEKANAFLELIAAGEREPEEYTQWLLNQMGRGRRYLELQEKLAQRLVNSRETAFAYINDATPGIYSLNRNFEAYTIEKVVGAADFTLFDERTVKRLIVEQPGLMPNWVPTKPEDFSRDLEYGKKMITKYVTSGILRGGSVQSIARELRDNITDMSLRSSILAARTAVTGAQNAGRLDSYAAAEEMGINLKKQWLATLDDRTRHSHAMLDGVQVEIDAEFPNGCRYPGDPHGEPAEVYNCRCTMVSVIDGHSYNGERRARTIDPETGKETWETIPNMTYQEWVKWKEAGNVGN